MSFKKYVYLMILGTLICLLGLAMVLTYFEPDSASWSGFALFYVSLGLSIVGLAALIGLLLRYFFGNDKLIFRDVINSFRQAVLFAILIVVVLALKSLDLMSWWSVLLLLFALTFLEVFLISYKSRNNL